MRRRWRRKKRQTRGSPPAAEMTSIVNKLLAVLMEGAFDTNGRSAGLERAQDHTHINVLLWFRGCCKIYGKGVTSSEGDKRER
jgi:hypothetical protein